MSAFGQDIRSGCRLLRRRPGFAAAVILCLGLGIGGVTAVFSVLHGVTVRFMPYERPDRLVFLIASGIFDNRTPLASAPYYLDWKAQNISFADMAAYQHHEPHNRWAGWADTQENLMDLQGLVVTPNFFTVLGMRTLLGRAFTEDDAGQSVVVLGCHVWRDRFAEDPQVIGQSVLLGGQVQKVVGVAAAHYRFFPTLDAAPPNRPVDYWIPVEPGFAGESRTNWNYGVLARLKPGIALARAQADMDRITDMQRKQYPDDLPERMRIVVQPVPQRLVGTIRSAAFLTLAGAAFVLLIACANVVNLLLVQAVRRKSEMAVRAALGSSRLRILRQWIAENFILVLAGGALGILLAWWGVDLLLGLAPGNFPGVKDIRLDGRVLAAALGLTFFCVFCVGLIPGIFAARPNLTNVLKDFGTRATSGRGERQTTRLIVVSEIVLSFVLVIGAGLLIQSYWHLMRVELGVQARHVLTLRVSGPNLMNRHDELLARLQSLPGVGLAGSTTGLPLSGESSDARLVSPVPVAEPSASYPVAFVRTVSTDYFRVLGASLARGRYFTAQDNERSNPVVIVNEALARKLWPGQDPVGRQMAFGHGSRVFYNGDEETLVQRQVIGVVRNIRYGGPDQEPPPETFIPFAQHTRRHYVLSVALHCQSDPAGLRKTVAREAQSVDPSLKIESMSTMDGFLSELTAQRRFLMALLSVFAAVAFALAVIGIYGVIAFTVSMRVREMGIRLAFGAQRRDILRLVLQHAAGLVLAGVSLGLVGTFILRKVVANQLFGISPLDPATLAVGIALVVLVPLAACYIPARRAARIDPMVALRHE